MQIWIWSFGGKISEVRKVDKVIEVVEVDEMHSFIGSKKKATGYGLLLNRCGEGFLNFIIGNRGNKTAEQIWEKIKKYEMKMIATNYLYYY